MSGAEFYQQFSMTHMTLLATHYELNGQFAEMKNRATVAELRLAEAQNEAEAHQEEIKDLEYKIKHTKKTMKTSKQRSSYWKKSAMNANASYLHWFKTGATARIEMRELKDKVIDLEAEAEKLRAFTTKAKDVALRSTESFWSDDGSANTRGSFKLTTTV